MEENLDKNNEINKEISDNTTKSNSEEIKDVRSEKDFNMIRNNGNSQSNSASKVGIKNEIDNPAGLSISFFIPTLEAELL